MFDAIRGRVLRFLRVPHEPAPPAGAPGSIRVFRAGRNFYKLKLIGWGVGQAGALVGIIFSLYFLARVEREAGEYQERVRRERVARAAAAKAAQDQAAGTAADGSQPAATPAAPAPANPDASAQTASERKDPPAAAKKSPRKRGDWREQTRTGLGRLVERWPAWIFPMLALLEYGGVLLYLVQIPVTYAIVRLDYEQRWYIVTDRSLRIRAGITSVLESTMSFANLQQVEVKQGPLQRLLGIADIKVQSAGGGGGEHEAAGGESLHSGVFHGVENAQEIRDLVLERLRRFRQAGLGDPDDHHQDEPGAAAATAAPGDAHAAAQELLAEARALREAVTRL